MARCGGGGGEYCTYFQSLMRNNFKFKIEVKSMKITQVHLPEITEEKLHNLAILQEKTINKILKE